MDKIKPGDWVIVKKNHGSPIKTRESYFIKEFSIYRVYALNFESTSISLFEGKEEFFYGIDRFINLGSSPSKLMKAIYGIE